MHGWYRDPDVTFSEPVNPDIDIDSETHQEVRRNYAAMIENIDRWAGRFRDRLRERGELDDTVTVFAADHGEMLGDHGRWRKSVPYHGSLRDPPRHRRAGRPDAGPSRDAGEFAGPPRHDTRRRGTFS